MTFIFVKQGKDSFSLTEKLTSRLKSMWNGEEDVWIFVIEKKKKKEIMVGTILGA